MAFRTLYLLSNVGFFLLTLVLSNLHDAAGVSAGYLWILFGLCSTPLLWLQRVNDRYVLLAIMMAFYFLFFGAPDFLSLFSEEPAADAEVRSGGADAAIIVGAASLLLGYLAVARSSQGARVRAPRDWPRRSVLNVGLVLWLIGSAAIVYLQVFVLPDKTAEAGRRGLAMMGPVVTFLVLIGNLVAPLGLLILAYGYAKFRTVAWLLIVLAILAAQVAIAFLTDIRGQALLPPAIVIVALTLKDGRIPKTWVAVSLLLLPVAFSVLSVYRGEIAGERGMSRTEAFNNLGKVLDIVLASAEKKEERGHKESLVGRASIKNNFEIEYAHTGMDRPFQAGQTLIAIPLAFIPRLVWPDKPDVPTGRLFNHEFFGQDSETFISPSHFGELYWNFGWPGIVMGMFLIGALLGLIGVKCDLSERQSVTRVLVLLATVQYICWGFEGAVGVQYVLWIRSMAAIGLLHVLFARPAAASEESVPRPTPLAVSPNLMR